MNAGAGGALRDQNVYLRPKCEESGKEWWGEKQLTGHQTMTPAACLRVNRQKKQPTRGNGGNLFWLSPKRGAWTALAKKSVGRKLVMRMQVSDGTEEEKGEPFKGKGNQNGGGDHSFGR